MKSDPDQPNEGNLGADSGPDETLQKFEKLVAGLAQPNYLFRLYVAGNTLRSTRAVANVRRIADRHLPGRYELEVIDVYQQPEAMKREQVVAVPTLIKELPLPSRTFVGDMSNTERILIGLNLKTEV